MVHREPQDIYQYRQPREAFDERVARWRAGDYWIYYRLHWLLRRALEAGGEWVYGDSAPYGEIIRYWAYIVYDGDEVIITSNAPELDRSMKGRWIGGYRENLNVPVSTYMPPHLREQG